MRISDWSSDVCSSDLRRRKSDTGGARQIAAAFIGFVAGKGGPCGGKAHMIGDLVLADFTQAGGAVCVKPCACEPGGGAPHIHRYDFFPNSLSISPSIAAAPASPSSPCCLKTCTNLPPRTLRR